MERGIPVAVFVLLFVGLVHHPNPLQAQKESNVSQTVHNLSATGPGTVKTTDSETEVCVFCHTPHGASNFPGSPLWNRSAGNNTYIPYASSSLDAETILGRQLDQPAGSSKLCLSCHDGTLALGTVNVFAGQLSHTFNMTDTNMPAGAGTLTGFTRNLGIELGNDHPISFNYDTTLAAADTELFYPASGAGSHIDVRGPGIKPVVPLEPTGPGGEGQVQCATCHDPHLYDPVATESIKFLRLNRFQQAPPAEGSFDENGDMVCLACHDKDGWSNSAHASSIVANETYISAVAPNLGEIPVGLPVWQVGCLNCHDTHTVHGSRRLLREGTDSVAVPKSGGDSAIEETCYQCHSSTPIITNISNEVPDIKTDFQLQRHMPITKFEQPAGIEVHDITDVNFSETQALMGKGNLNNRHVECTDCHNPHRVMRSQVFNGTGLTTEGTHDHSTGHTNIASGVLRGSWGVEPVYGSSSFLSLPTNYNVKKGDGGLGAPPGATGDDFAYVTREYQVCLKCHSDYGYDDSGSYPTGGRPVPGASGGDTTFGTNNLTEYTNQAMEFQAPLGDKGEPGGNHRSWHPVIDITDRTPSDRRMASNSQLFLSPWDSGNIGNQTMYCTDCHGSANTTAEGSVPSGNNPWGPHGSTNNFILKGPWDTTTGSNDSGLCFRCHAHNRYATDVQDGCKCDEGCRSGFSDCSNDTGNLHAVHAKRVGQNLRCNWCHTAVPHGFKNKALLVNLNDVGPEAGQPTGTEVPITSGGGTRYYNQGPYYMNAKLKIRTWRTSGNWTQASCGSAGGGGGTGGDWMKNVCDPP
jgi:hypothetical protein